MTESRAGLLAECGGRLARRAAGPGGPQEAFVDLDAWLSGGAGGGGGGCFVGGLGLQPCPADARLYVALTYEEAGPRFTFFQSSRGHCQIMNILRIYYSPSIIRQQQLTRHAGEPPVHLCQGRLGVCPSATAAAVTLHSVVFAAPPPPPAPPESHASRSTKASWGTVTLTVLRGMALLTTGPWTTVVILFR